MREFEGFRERTKLDNLLRHLLWEDDPVMRQSMILKSWLKIRLKCYMTGWRIFLQSSGERTTACLKR